MHFSQTVKPWVYSGRMDSAASWTDKGLPQAPNANSNGIICCRQLVETLFSEARSRGRHSATWDASDRASGVYLCRLTGTDRH